MIFTAGIGLIIYLIIYYNKPINRCIHCNSIIHPSLPTQQPQTTSKINNILSPLKPQISNQASTKQKTKKGDYCSYCGELIPDKKIKKFCAHCGTKFDD